MTIKEYLNQIQSYREYIRQLKARKENLHIAYTGLSGIDYSGDKVQTSTSNKLEAEGWKLIERLQKIDDEIERVSIQIDDISDKIGSLDDDKYSKLLFMRYYDGKSLKDISKEFDLEYSRVCKLHGQALKAFKRKYTDCQQIAVNSSK